VDARRRARQSREEIRRHLLAAGVAVLRDEGLGTGVEALTFKRVFDRVEQDTGTRYTNASVIRRVWENQAEFQIDVLLAVALGQSGGEVDGAIEAMGPVLARLDRSSPAARMAALRELCRVGGALTARSLRQSVNWPLLIGVWALAVSGEPVDDRKRIAAALLDGYDAFTSHVESAYAAMTDYLGFRVGPPLTLRQFVIATDALGEGYGLRDRIDDSMMTAIVRPTGPHGTEQEWSLFGVALEGLVFHFFEIDPDWSPRAARSARSD
jgi:hypothetical protein